jgi:hypothetical protein
MVLQAVHQWSSCSLLVRPVSISSSCGPNEQPVADTRSWRQTSASRGLKFCIADVTQSRRSIPGRRCQTRQLKHRQLLVEHRADNQAGATRCCPSVPTPRRARNARCSQDSEQRNSWKARHKANKAPYSNRRRGDAKLTNVRLRSSAVNPEYFPMKSTSH